MKLAMFPVTESAAMKIYPDIMQSYARMVVVNLNIGDYALIEEMPDI